MERTMDKLLPELAAYRKYYVALLGILGQFVALLATADQSGLIPEKYRSWVVVVVALATALGVRRAPNGSTDSGTSAGEDAP
jgi:hypothetical protein